MQCPLSAAKMGILVLDAAADPGQQEHSRAEGSQILRFSHVVEAAIKSFLGRQNISENYDLCLGMNL